MKLRVGLAVTTLALVLTGCSSGKVPLRYDFDSGPGARYLWNIDSTTVIDSRTDSSTRRVEMEVEVLEKAGKDPKTGDRILDVTLTPVSLKQAGVAARTPGPVKVRYLLDSRGRILKPAASKLADSRSSALELGTILSQSRLALPGRRVGIGDTWNAPLRLEGDTGKIDLTGEARLLGFGLEARRKLARIATERSGKITALEPLAGVLVELKGNTTSSSTASLDLDRGILYSSASRFTSDFNLALEETGELRGTLKVTLNSKLQLQPA